MPPSIPARQRRHRSETAALLKLFAEPLLQEAMREDMPEEQLPEALCRVWFDEVFVPSERYFDCPKGDLDQSAVRSYWEEFSEEEQEALVRFHGCLELRLDLIAKSGRKLADSEPWHSICRDAANALFFLQ